MAKSTKKNKDTTTTVIIKKAVDGYHQVDTAIDVPLDTYHKALIKVGYLEQVKAEKKTEDKPDKPAEETKSEGGSDVKGDS